MLAAVGDVDVVEAGREGDVLHAAAAIFVVLARHLGLGRTLDGDAETADAGPPGGERRNLEELQTSFFSGVWCKCFSRFFQLT